MYLVSGKHAMDAKLFEVMSPLGVGTVLFLERDACSMAK